MVQKRQTDSQTDNKAISGYPVIILSTVQRQMSYLPESDWSCWAGCLWNQARPSKLQAQILGWVYATGCFLTQHFLISIMQCHCPKCRTLNEERTGDNSNYQKHVTPWSHIIFLCVWFLQCTALTLLVWRQKEHPACKNWVMSCWVLRVGVVICLERGADCIWSSWYHCITRPLNISCLI